MKNVEIVNSRDHNEPSHLVYAVCPEVFKFCLNAMFFFLNFRNTNFVVVFYIVFYGLVTGSIC